MLRASFPVPSQQPAAQPAAHAQPGRRLLARNRSTLPKLLGGQLRSDLCSDLCSGQSSCAESCRPANFLNADGSFNELNFRAGLYKSRFVIIVSWFMFGKGNFIWVLVFAQFLHDYRPDLFPTPKDLGLFKIGTFI